MSANGTALTKEQTRAYEMIPEVRANHREHIKAGKEAIKYAMQAGQLLNKMKPLVKHGEWEDIVEKCGVEVRIAQLYMRLAKELPKLVAQEVLSEYTIRGGLKLIADHKKDGDQEKAKNETVSLLKSASADEKTTSENGKAAAPSESSGARKPVDAASTPPVEPNECAPGKHKWDDAGDCEKCHVAKAVAEPTKPAPEPAHREMFVDLLEHVRQCILLIDKIHNSTDKRHGQLHESVMNSLDIAGQDAKKWRGLCK